MDNKIDTKALREAIQRQGYIKDETTRELCSFMTVVADEIDHLTAELAEKDVQLLEENLQIKRLESELERMREDKRRLDAAYDSQHREIQRLIDLHTEDHQAAYQQERRAEAAEALCRAHETHINTVETENAQLERQIKEIVESGTIKLQLGSFCSIAEQATLAERKRIVEIVKNYINPCVYHEQIRMTAKFIIRSIERGKG